MNGQSRPSYVSGQQSRLVGINEIEDEDDYEQFHDGKSYERSPNNVQSNKTLLIKKSDVTNANQLR